jgi:class 3 adenylate cyclase
MQANYISYDHIKSAARIQDILDASNSNFETVDSIPSRDKLTFTNGFYVNCTALFVDIRGSSDLTNEHTRPVLSKIYRAYISEVVAVMNGATTCAEVNIVGDCVNSIHDTPLKSQIDEVFSTAAEVSSLIDILNHKLKKKNYTIIEVGIGIAYGRALMIKAGYSGSGINDVVWMGDVVNEASNLCSNANKAGTYETMVSNVVQNNLNDHNKGLLSYCSSYSCYHGHIINTAMNDWLKEQK